MQITVKLLYRRRACKRSVGFIAPMLPITLYSTIEMNLETANKLVAYYKESPLCTCRECLRVSTENRFRIHLLTDLMWFLHDVITDKSELTRIEYETTEKPLSGYVLAKVMTETAKYIESNNIEQHYTTTRSI